jgi:Cof subfamily protein (haloacid dehalogenase superfamily)
MGYVKVENPPLTFPSTHLIIPLFETTIEDTMHTQKPASPAYQALVGIDLDGTLLTYNDEISPANRAAIQQAIAGGTAVALISGRTVCGITQYSEILNLRTPCCGAGGAIIFDPLNGKMLRHLPLSEEERTLILQVAEKLPITVYCHEYDQIYVQNGDPDTLKIFQKRVSCQIIECPDMLKEYKRIPSKITLVGETSVLRDIQTTLLQIHPLLNAFVTAPDTLEISQHGAHKGTALVAIAEMLGISPEKTIGIGDEENDREMLAAAGIGVAMGNANEALKTQADCIAPINHEDGVAWVFNTVLPRLLD